MNTVDQKLISLYTAYNNIQKCEPKFYLLNQTKPNSLVPVSDSTVNKFPSKKSKLSSRFELMI